MDNAQGPAPSSSRQPNPSRRGLISSPTRAFCRRPLLISPLFTNKSCCSYNPWFNLKSIRKAEQPQRAQVVSGSHPALSNQALLQLGISPNRKRLVPVVSCSSETAGSTEGPKEKPKEGDHRAVETVQKLYTAIKNKNVKGVSDVLGDECQCFCDFISASQPFHGKKQVLEIFGHLMRILEDNASINFGLSMRDGMTVGVSWRLKWKNNLVPLGTGFSLLVCQEYRGKVAIQNVGMVMDPLIHLGPLGLKIAAVVMLIIDKFVPFPLLDIKKRKQVYVFLTLFFTFVVLLFLIKASH